VKYGTRSWSVKPKSPLPSTTQRFSPNHEIPEVVVREIPGAGHVICEETPDVVLGATEKFLALLV